MCVQKDQHLHIHTVHELEEDKFCILYLRKATQDVHVKSLIILTVCIVPAQVAHKKYTQYNVHI